MKAATATKKPSTEIPRDLAVQQASVMKGKLPALLATQTQYDSASDYLKRLINFRKSWQEYWKEPIVKAKELYDDLRGKRDEVDKPAEIREREVRNLLSDFIRRKDAEEALGRDRRAQEAENLARQHRTAEISEAEKLGAPAEIVEAMKEQPVAITAPAPVTAFRRAEGQTSYDKWGAVCLDKQALIVHCASHPEDANLLDVNEMALRKRAESQHELFNVPGCECRKEKIVRSARY